MSSHSHHNLHSKLSAAGLLITLGIIYGDIGTSPLYVMKSIVGDRPISSDLVLGGISCIFWTLTLQTTVKYIVLTLRADNKGEGGIFSLYALVRRTKVKWLLFPAIIGGAALLGEGIITPAISVSSAIEGLTERYPGINTIPIIIGILFALFAIQQFGTKFIGKFFGPVMLVWFSMLAILGIAQIAGDLSVFKAINPAYAYTLLFNYPQGFIILGAVFLCTTGAAVLLPDQMPVPVEITIIATTVKDYFTQLGKKLNEANADLIPGAANYANEYEFVVDETIGNSKIVDETYIKFTKTNPKAPGQDFKKQSFTIPAKSNLLNVIGRMMMQSNFFTTTQGIGETYPDGISNRVPSLDQIYNTFKITAKTQYQGLNQDGQRVEKVFDDKTGSMPQKYTIYISQYSIYQNPHPRGNNALVDASLYAIKKYDYIYTGKNLDITDLNLTFNTTYYTAFMTNPFNIASTEVGPGTKRAEDVVNKTRDIIVHPGTIFSQLKKLANPSPAVFRGELTNPAIADKNPNVQTAKDIARSLFSRPGGDMIVCHLGIVGDPTLIKQDDWLYTPDPTAGGNYNASTSQATFASKFGHVRMDTAEVVVEVNVNTPLDMDMDIEGGYGNQGLYFPGPGVYRSLFSGTYKIITIKNNFSKGIFTQKLEMVRYINDTLVKQGAKVVIDAVAQGRADATPSLQVNGP